MARPYQLTIAALAAACCLNSVTVYAQAAPEGERTPADRACINVHDIVSYRVISDELVQLEMAGTADILMRLNRHCPQLHFHKYLTYTPVNGQLCARVDDITTRSGTPCRIASFSEIDAKPAIKTAAKPKG